MRAEFLAPAAAEFSEAVAYYESRREGLGSEFAAEVRRTIDRVLQYPDAWAPLSPRTRRCRTNRFPYLTTTFPGQAQWRPRVSAS
jgi:hypothetical protein